MSLKRENFNKKNAEIVFYSLNNLDIHRNGDSFVLFRLFSMYLKDKAFK